MGELEGFTSELGLVIRGIFYRASNNDYLYRGHINVSAEFVGIKLQF